MIELTQFLSVLLGGIALTGMAIAVGGAAFAVLVLRRDRGALDLLQPALARALRIVAVGSIAAASARVLALLLVPLTFADDAGHLPFAELIATTYARATLAHALAALALAWAASSIGGMAASRLRWMAMSLAAVLVLATAAWLTHAASRVDSAGTLMLTTLAHELGAALWVGGIAQLAFLRPLLKGRPEDPGVWPRLLARFSPVALSAVVLLLAAGVYLAWQYIGDWTALIGTGYGAMVLAKSVLLTAALGLGALNFFAARRWRTAGDSTGVEERVPAYLEAELAVVIAALLTAASLTSQPPAVDVQDERASAGEVFSFFAPKKPVLVPPSRAALLATAAATGDTFATPNALEHEQNNFNHNIAGLLVLIIGFAAAVDRSGRVTLARHWPLLFLSLAAFIFVFAEPTVWPMGDEGFWSTLVVPGVLQHRVAVLLVMGLAFFEWRVRVGGLGTTRWRLVFPSLCAAGGAMLLTHSHSVFASRSEFLIELSHAALGLLAVFVGVGRWLELRLPAPAGRAAGRLWPACLMAVGLVLLFYREG